MSVIIDGVFIHARDLPRAARWYSDLLGVPLRGNELDRPYYTLPTAGGQPWLTLDGHAHDPGYEHAPGSGPLMSIRMPDLHAARERALVLGAHDVTDIETVHEGLRAFRLRDADGNVLMMLQRD